MPEVQSSYLKSFDYDPESKTFSVEFRDGKRFRYEGVSKPTYDAFQASGSKGRFFREAIRDHHKATPWL